MALKNLVADMADGQKIPGEFLDEACLDVAHPTQRVRLMPFGGSLKARAAFPPVPGFDE